MSNTSSPSEDGKRPRITLRPKSESAAPMPPPAAATPPVAAPAPVTEVPVKTTPPVDPAPSPVPPVPPEGENGTEKPKLKVQVRPRGPALSDTSDIDELFHSLEAKVAAKPVTPPPAASTAAVPADVALHGASAAHLQQHGAQVPFVPAEAPAAPAAPRSVPPPAPPKVQDPAKIAQNLAKRVASNTHAQTKKGTKGKLLLAGTFGALILVLASLALIPRGKKAGPADTATPSSEAAANADADPAALPAALASIPPEVSGEPNPAIVAALEGLRFRPLSQQNRIVLMINGVVYPPGSMIDPSLGYLFVGVDPKNRNSYVFTDLRGVRYLSSQRSE